MKVYSELIAAQLENLSSDPTPASKGRVYFNTTTNKAKLYDGTAWQSLGYVTSVITKSSNYVATNADDIILTSGNTTITLPTAVGFVGKLTIKKADGAGTTTSVIPTGGQLIDGEVQQLITSQYTAITVISDGANWALI